MKDIREKELETMVKPFNYKSAQVSYIGLVNITLNIKKLKLLYNYKTGFLYIKDLIHKSNSKVNLASAYSIKIKENYSKLIIKLDNNISIYLKIKE